MVLRGFASFGSRSSASSVAGPGWAAARKAAACFSPEYWRVPKW